MIEFSDYECPFCARHQAQTEPLIAKAFLATGQVRLVIRDFPIPELHQQAMKAAEAANCASDQGKFWAMHDALFARQSEWAGKDDTLPLFKGIATDLGMDGDKLAACVQANTYAGRIQKDIEAGQKAGVTGTPSFLINNKLIEGAQPFDQFAIAIAHAASGQADEPTAESKTSEGTQSSGNTARDQLAVDPKNPGLTLDGSPTLGQADAPIIMLEFSDFQCPFCHQYFKETHPTLMKTYGDTGKVRFVFKHMPLPIHPNAPKAAQAAECAKAQGQFWAMHDKLFNTQSDWQGLADPTASFKTYAVDLKLNTADFNRCLDSDQGKTKIDTDSKLGTANGVTGTPSFFVIKGDKGARVPGAVPLSLFNQIIEQVINDKG